MPRGSRSSAAASCRYSWLIRVSAQTPSGKITTTSQAPSVNLVTAKIRTTAAEMTAASALSVIFTRRSGSRRRRWYAVRPDPAMVKAVNTPIAYRATSLSTLAPVASSSASEMTASEMMPFEKASR